MTSQFWLLAYEAPMRGWLGDKKIVKNEESFFAELAKKDIHFYDEGYNGPPWQTKEQWSFEKRKEHGYEYDQEPEEPEYDEY